MNARAPEARRLRGRSPPRTQAHARRAFGGVRRFGCMADVLLRNDKEWSVIDGELCRVRVFTPWASVDDGRVTAPTKTEPYASIVVECDALPQEATGAITHRTDFLHLWSAFNERGVQDDEEVLVFWTRRYLKSYARLMSKFMPRLWVMICPKQAFELMTDDGFKPELTGVARWEAQRPLVEWKPGVMA